LGTGFKIRAIAQRPESATATGSPEGGGRRVNYRHDRLQGESPA